MKKSYLIGAAAAPLLGLLLWKLFLPQITGLDGVFIFLLGFFCLWTAAAFPLRLLFGLPLGLRRSLFGPLSRPTGPGSDRIPPLHSGKPVPPVRHLPDPAPGTPPERGIKLERKG